MTSEATSFTQDARFGAVCANTDKGTVYLWTCLQVAFVRPGEFQEDIPARIRLRWSAPEAGEVHLHLEEAPGGDHWLDLTLPASAQASFDQRLATFGCWFLAFQGPDTDGEIQQRFYAITEDGTVLLMRDASGKRLWRVATMYGARDLADHYMARFAPENRTPRVRRLVRRWITALEAWAPLPWEPHQKSFHADCIREYQRVLFWTHTGAANQEIAQASARASGMDLDSVLLLNRIAWAKMKNARVFEVRPAAFFRLYHSCARWVDRTVGDGTGADERRLRLRELAKALPFPEHLPFDVCWFGFGEGVLLRREDLLVRGDKPREWAEADLPVLLLGVLVAHDQEGIEYLWQPELGQISTTPIRYAHNYEPAPGQGSWAHAESLMPWVTHLLISGVNDHRAVVEGAARTITDQLNFKRFGKKLHLKAMAPPPFYVVYLKDAFIRERPREVLGGQVEIEHEHRWDVRGHEAVWIRRGPLPLEPKVRRQLLGRGFREIQPHVFVRHHDPKVTDPYAAALRVLVERGIPARRSSEWVSICVAWVQDHIKGPADKPYVPSARRATRGAISR